MRGLDLAKDVVKLYALEAIGAKTAFIEPKSAPENGALYSFNAQMWTNCSTNGLLLR